MDTKERIKEMKMRHDIEVLKQSIKMLEDNTGTKLKETVLNDIDLLASKLLIPINDQKEVQENTNTTKAGQGEEMKTLSAGGEVSKERTPRIDKDCAKCKNTGWFGYDKNHSQICDKCCPHDMGFWLLEEHYGDDNGKVCCLRGCGYTREVSQSRNAVIDEKKTINDFVRYVFDEKMGKDPKARIYLDMDGDVPLGLLGLKELMKQYLALKANEGGTSNKLNDKEI